MRGDELSESAKAAQEIAKTTRTGLEVAKDFGSWVAELISEPVGEVSGMISDHFKVVRWERQQRLRQRVEKYLEDLSITDNDRQPVPIKIALEAVQHASVEENDEIQDMWARLLAASADPGSKVRVAYMDIIRALDPIDARVLDLLGTTDIRYSSEIKLSDHKSGLVEKRPPPPPAPPNKSAATVWFDSPPLLESFDNLSRLGLISWEGPGAFREIKRTNLGIQFWVTCLSRIPTKDG
jgi:hypothetical protein